MYTQISYVCIIISQKQTTRSPLSACSLRPEVFVDGFESFQKLRLIEDVRVLPLRRLVARRVFILIQPPKHELEQHLRLVGQPPRLGLLELGALSPRRAVIVPVLTHDDSLVVVSGGASCVPAHYVNVVVRGLKRMDFCTGAS